MTTAPDIPIEPMIDGRRASVVLNLPYFWFSDPSMRSRHSIPHYLLGGVVRYRLSELSEWAKSNQAVVKQTQREGGDHAGLQ